MRKLFLILFVAATCHAADLPLSDGDRIAFAGDSNMSQWRWVHYVTSYLVLMNPTLKLHIWCAARGGTAVDSWRDDPTGYHGYDEYSKNDYAMQPKYVFAMLGVNGGETASVFAPKMEDLVSTYIVQNGAIPIVMGPICVPGGASSNLSGKDDAVIAFCATHGWTNVRTYHDMAPTVTNPANFVRTTDSIAAGHYSVAAHIIEAYLVMKDLGWTTNVSTATINGSSATLTGSDHCTISGLAGNAYSGVDFNRLDARLPWAIDESNYDGNARQMATDMLPELAGWLDYSVTITGLSSGVYNVFCDDVQIASGISNITLSSGWNMADLTSGPVFDQVQEVLGRIRDMQGVDRVTLASKSPNHGIVRWRSNTGAYYGSQGKRGSDLISAMQPAVTELNGYDDLIHSAAQPIIRHYSIRSSVPVSTPTVFPTPTATCTCPG